ncbi:MAG: TatD family hydrolase [Tenuifilaceae bacterium]|nr:TatD family hydrolase [Tenuifilaceae bacterium]
MLIDTHTHIFASEFNHDRAQTIERAKAEGVGGMVMPNIDSKSVDDLLSTAQQFPGYCFPCMGLHPTSVKDNFEEELRVVDAHLARQKFFAIGEIGIDLYWDKTFIQQQREAFRYQVKLAKQLRLPIIIHARQSFQEIFDIIDQENDSSLTGVFHSFTGTLEDYQQIADYGGFMVGIGGVVTYKHGGVDKVVTRMDVDRILVETDSPYLSPVPQRGKRNESANLKYIVSKVAELLDVPTDEFAARTTRNAKKLFSLELG